MTRFFLFLFSTLLTIYSSFAQAVFLNLDSEIKNDTLFLTYSVRNGMLEEFAPAFVDFVVEVDTSLVRIQDKIIVERGRWDAENNSNYDALALSLGITPQFNLQLRINSGVYIDNINPGAAELLGSGATEQVAIVGIPLKRCSFTIAPKWVDNPVGQFIRWSNPPDMGTDVWTGLVQQSAPIALTVDNTVDNLMIDANAINICSGQEVTINANRNDLDFYDFYVNGVLEESYTPFVSNTIQDQDEVYLIAGFGDLCRDTSNTITFSTGAGNLDLGDDIEVCYNETVTINSGKTAGAGISFSWNVVNNPGGTNDTPDVTFITSTSQQIILQYDSLGCTASDTINLTVTPPLPPFIATPTTVFLSEDSVAFNWPAVANADTYEVQIEYAYAGGGVYISPFTDNSSTETGHAIGGLAVGDQVRITYKALNSCGEIISAPLDVVITACNASWAGINPTQIYCTASFFTVLTPEKPGGFFTGSGVKQSGGVWYFDPSDAGAGSHTVSYIDPACEDTVSRIAVVQGSPCVSTVVSGPTSAYIKQPFGIFTSCAGEIFTSSNQINAIVRIDTFGVAHIVTGDTLTSGFLDGAVSVARLNRPYGIVGDLNGVIYFVDGNNHAVRKIEGGVVTTLAGGGPAAGTGVSGVVGDSDNPADKTANRMFNQPFGITMNFGQDTLYVSDAGNRKIKGISLLTNDVFTIAGIGTTGGTALPAPNAAPVPALDVQFLANSLAHLNADANYIYIPRRNQGTIYGYNFSTGNIDHLVGIGVGTEIGNGSTEARFFRPHAAVADGVGNLYIADTDNASIKLAQKNTPIAPAYEVSLAAGDNNDPGCVDGDMTTARFTQPMALSVFVKGFLDIADQGCDNIRRFAIQDYLNNPLDSLDATYCQGAEVDTLNPTTVSGIYYIDGVLMDSTGGYWKFNPVNTGTFEVCYEHRLGPCGSQICEDVIVHPLPSINLGADTSLCAEAFGRDSLLVDGIYNSYLWEFASGSDPFSPLASTDSATVIHDSGTYILTVENQFGCINSDTIEIGRNPLVNVAVQSSASAPVCFEETATLTVDNVINSDPALVSYRWNTSEITSSIIASVSGVYNVEVINELGCVGTASTSFTKKSTPSLCINVDSRYRNTDNSAAYGEWIVNLLAGDATGTAGLADNTIGTNAMFNEPHGITLHDGFLYISEIQNRRVRRIDLQDSMVTTYLGLGAGTANVNVPLGDAILGQPTGLDVDQFGRLFISDRSAHRVLYVENDSLFLLAGTGTAGFVDGDTSVAQFNTPIDIIADNFGRVIVADYQNNVIRVIEADQTVYTYAGNETGTAGNTDGTASNASFNLPKGIALDASGRLIISDEGNHRIRMVDLDTASSTLTGSSIGAVDMTAGVEVPLATARYNQPNSVYVNNQGQIFLTDAANNAIRLIDPQAGVSTIAGNGVVGNVLGLGKDARFISPSGIVQDPTTGIVYVVDKGSNAVKTLQKNKEIRVCPSEQPLLSANCTEAGASINWTFPMGGTSSNNAINASEEGWYFVEIDVNGCISRDSVLVSYNVVPAFASISSDTTICYEQTVALNAQAIGDSITMYYNNGVTNLRLSAFETLTHNVDTTALGVYSFVVSNEFCRDSQTVVVNVTNLALAMSIVSDSLCFGDSTTVVSAATGGAGGYQYTWGLAGGVITAIDANSTFIRPTVTGNNTYTGLVEDAYGCTAGAMGTVFLNTPVTSNFSNGSVFICGNVGTPNNVTAFPSGGIPNYTYLWRSSSPSRLLLADTTNATVRMFSQTPVPSQVYAYLQITDQLGCTYEDTLSVVLEAFVVDIQPIHEIVCPGFPDTLNVVIASGGSGNYDYTWFNLPSSSVTLSGGESIIVYPNTTRQYLVSVEDLSTGCNFADSVRIVVNPIISNINPNTDIVACSGDFVELSGSGSTGAVPYTVGDPHLYTWSIINPGTGIVVSGTEDSVIARFSGGDVGTTSLAQLAITDSLGCKDSSNVEIYWNTPLAVTATEDTTYVCYQSTNTITLNPITGGEIPYSYQWTILEGNVEIVGANNADELTVRFPDTSPNDTSRIVVEVRDRFNCFSTDTVVVIGTRFEVQAIATYPITCPGTPNPLSVLIINGYGGPYDYVWSPVPDDVANIADPIISTDGDTEYFVTVTDQKTNCSATSSVAVTIVTLQAQIGNTLAYDTLAVCFGDSISLSAENSTGGTVFGVGFPYLYEWSQVSGTPISFLSDTDETVTYFDGTEGEYTQILLKITDSLGCESFDSTMIYWNPELTITAGLDSFYVCTPASYELTTPVITGGTATYAIDWSVISGSALINGNDITTNAGELSEIRVEVTDALGCRASDTVDVIGLNFGISLIAQHDTICPGLNNELSVATIQDGRGTYTYAWSPQEGIKDTTLATYTVNPLITSSYSLEIEDITTGCIANASIEIQVRELFAVINSLTRPDTSAICFGDVFTMNADNSYGGNRITVGDPYTYEWNILSGTATGFVSGDVSREVSIANGTEGDYDQYELIIQDALGCEAKDTITLFWNPELSISAGLDSFYVCTPASYELTTPVITGGTATYAIDWSVISGSALINGNDITTNAGELSEIRVQVTDGLGCRASDTVEVIGLDFGISLIAQHDTICPGLDNELSVATIQDGRGTYTYAWSPQEGIKDTTLATYTVNPLLTSSYSLEIEDITTGCIANSSIEIQVRELFAIINSLTRPDTSAVCFGDVFTMNADNSYGGNRITVGDPYTYEWNILSGTATGFTSGDVSREVSIANGTEGDYDQYELIIQDALGCEAKDTVTLFWNPELTVSADNDLLYVCLPSTGEVNFQSIAGGTPNYNYQWSVASSVLNTATLDPNSGLNTFVTVERGDTANIVLTATDRYNCAATDTTEVIGLLFEVNAVAEYPDVCAGFDNELSVQLVQDFVGGYTYEWTPDEAISSVSSANPTVNPTTPTTYSVLVSDAGTGCTAQSQIAVSIYSFNAVAGPTLGLDTLASCYVGGSSQSVTISATLSSGGQTDNGQYFYTWTSPSANINISNPTGETSIVNHNNVADLAEYTLVYLDATDSIGCPARDSLYIYWNSELEVVLPPNATSVCVGDEVIIEGGQTGGAPAYSYAWSEVGVSTRISILGATNEQDVRVVVSSFSPNDFETLRLIVTDRFGCSDEGSVVVKSERTTVSVIANQDTLCPGSELILTATGTSTALFPTPRLHYSFNSTNNYGISNLFSDNPTQTATYRVYAIDSVTLCRVFADIDIVTEELVFTLNNSGQGDLCFGEQVTITASDISGGSSPYTATWTLNENVIAGTNAVVSPTPLPTMGLTNANYIAYSVVDATGCSYKDSIRLRMNEQLFADAGDDKVLCIDAIETIGRTPAGSGGSGSYNYNWTTLSGTTPTKLDDNNVSETIFRPLNEDGVFTYLLNVRDAALTRCVVRDTVRIDVRPLPYLNMSNTFVCEDSSRTIYADVDRIRMYHPSKTFVWTNQNNVVLPFNRDSLVVSAEGIYTLTITDTVGCINRGQTMVEQIRIPFVSIINLDTLGCTNQALTLNALYTPQFNDSTRNDSTRWYVNGGNGILTNENRPQASYLPSFNDGLLQIVVEYKNVCAVAYDTVSVLAQDPPVAQFIVTDTLINNDQQITYTNTSFGSNLSYLWEFEKEFNTRENYTIAGPLTVYYPEEGRFYSQLVATDTLTGCADTSLIAIRVQSTYILFVPNVFSPEANHVDNQTFKVFGTNISGAGFDFRVYNRWGDLLYQTNSAAQAMSAGWNGKAGGVDQSMGVYTYTLKGEYVDGKKFEKFGTVTLIR